GLADHRSRSLRDASGGEVLFCGTIYMMEPALATGQGDEPSRDLIPLPWGGASLLLDANEREMPGDVATNTCHDGVFPGQLSIDDDLDEAACRKGACYRAV